MLKRVNYIFLFLSFCSLAGAQSWVPVGGGINGYVNILFVYDSVLYAGGSFNSPGNNIAQWNGLSWDSLGAGINNEVSAISRYKSKVYMGGFFSKAGGHSAGSIAIWDGANFTSPGIDIEGGGVQAMQVYDSLLYIGGQFDSINHRYLSSAGLASWDGTRTDSVGPNSLGSQIYSLASYNGLLIIGRQQYSTQYAFSWNNARINYFGNYFSSYSYVTLFAFCVESGTLFTGGTFDYAGGYSANNIAEYNGSGWERMGSGINGPVYALTAFRNLLIAGGSFDSAGGNPANNIAMWDGTTWTAIGNGVNGPVYALAVFDSTLYAGGNFTSPGTGIAMFTGSLGVNELQNLNNLSVVVYANPTNGIFNITARKEQGPEPGLNLKIDIYNMLGENIFNGTLNNQNPTTINISEQPRGIYIYRILSADGVPLFYGKLVIA